jgi:hypothetical protein
MNPFNVTGGGCWGKFLTMATIVMFIAWFLFAIVYPALKVNGY